MLDQSMFLDYGPLMQSKNLDSSPRVTATQKLATHLIGQDVQVFIAERRAKKRAWRFIARDLYEATDGAVDVAHETLRQWYGDEAA